MKDNQHFVFKGYLKNWGTKVPRNDGSGKKDYWVYVFDKANINAVPEHSRTSDILFEKNLYTITNDMRLYFNEYENISNDLSKDCMLIENSLDNFIENNFEKDIKKFINEVKQKKNKLTKSIQESTAKSVYKHYIIMGIRNPNFDLMGHKALFDRFIENCLIGLEDEKLRKNTIDLWKKVLWLKDIYKALFNLEMGTAAGFMELMKDIGSISLYEIANAEDGLFITSDMPVFIDKAITSPCEGNWGYFPISPKNALIFGRQKNGHNYNEVSYEIVTKETVEKLNKLIIKNSYSKVISSTNLGGL